MHPHSSRVKYTREIAFWVKVMVNFCHVSYVPFRELCKMSYQSVTLWIWNLANQFLIHQERECITLHHLPSETFNLISGFIHHLSWVCSIYFFYLIYSTIYMCNKFPFSTENFNVFSRIQVFKYGFCQVEILIV